MKSATKINKLIQEISDLSSLIHQKSIELSNLQNEIAEEINDLKKEKVSLLKENLELQIELDR